MINSKAKRFLALISAILLFSMYIITLIAAITASPTSNGFFMASLFCTVAIPALLYAMNLAYRIFSKRSRQNQSETTDKTDLKKNVHPTNMMNTTNKTSRTNHANATNHTGK